MRLLQRSFVLSKASRQGFLLVKSMGHIRAILKKKGQKKKKKKRCLHDRMIIIFSFLLLLDLLHIVNNIGYIYFVRALAIPDYGNKHI